MGVLNQGPVGHRKAVDFFWPRGMWDGYVKFFGNMPGGLGNRLVNLLYNGFSRHDAMLLEEAVEIFKNPGIRKNGSWIIVKPEAVKAIELIQGCLDEMSLLNVQSNDVQFMINTRVLGL
jgi:hypothetical protein